MDFGAHSESPLAVIPAPDRHWMDVSAYKVKVWVAVLGLVPGPEFCQDSQLPGA